MEDPVTTLSDKFIKLKPSEFQIINSSAILDMCIAHTEQLYKKSTTKSLSDIVSTELLVGLLKPNFFVVSFLSILKKFLLMHIHQEDFH